MKKWTLRVFGLSMPVVLAFGLLAMGSYRKALRVENDVLKPSLSRSLAYKRVARFKLFDPWESAVPHWTISYYEVPTDLEYETPSVTINIFGELVSWRSKEVWGMLVEKGYRDGD